MRKFELTTFLGLIIGLGAIATSMVLDGIRPAFLLQPSAFLIVIGGTLGAVIVRSGVSGVIGATRQTLLLFRSREADDSDSVIAQLAWLVRAARRDGHRVFERYANATDDKLMARGLTFASEYAEPAQVSSALEKILDRENETGLRNIAILESAGSYAPTFGILGAVLGLIHVLRAIDNPGELGTGIATAFVATIYGVGIANLFFFPLAGRLRERHQAFIRGREKVAEALIAVCANESPASIKQRLER